MVGPIPLRSIMSLDEWASCGSITCSRCFQGLFLRVSSFSQAIQTSPILRHKFASELKFTAQKGPEWASTHQCTIWPFCPSVGWQGQCFFIGWVLFWLLTFDFFFFGGHFLLNLNLRNNLPPRYPRCPADLHLALPTNQCFFLWLKIAQWLPGFSTAYQ